MADKTLRLRKPRYLPAIGAGVFAVLCGSVLFAYNSGVFKAGGESFLAIENLPDGAVVETFLHAQKKVHSLRFENGAIDLPEEQSRSLSAPYRVTSSIRMPDTSYRDFTWQVDTKNTLAVIVDGFKAGDFVYLALNGTEIVQKLPLDWSGKIELNAPLPDKKSVTACVDVSGDDGNFHFCHAIGERRPS